MKHLSQEAVSQPVRQGGTMAVQPERRGAPGQRSDAVGRSEADLWHPKCAPHSHPRWHAAGTVSCV